MVLDAMSLPALGALAALSSVVIELIYDPRYHEAGWMLRALCVRVAMMCVLTPSDSCLLALGQARFTLIQGIARSVWLFVGAPIGFYFFGIHGLVWAVALSELPVAVVVFIPLHRTGILRPKREFLAPVLFVAGGALGFALEGPIRNLLF
jgi:O-antigen/teichoic acid export membrane protein